MSKKTRKSFGELKWVNKKNLLGPTTNSLGILTKNKNIKDEIENKLKNRNIVNNSLYGNSNHKAINNKSGGLFKKRTLKSKTFE